MGKTIRLFLGQSALFTALSVLLAVTPAPAWEREGEQVSEGDHHSMNMNENLQMEAAGETARQRTEQMVGEVRRGHRENNAEFRGPHEGLHEATAYPEYTSSATVTEADLPRATNPDPVEDESPEKNDQASETRSKDQEAEVP
jgi:hypothetical protein